ncbi:hypothetical protein [Nocardioides ultimimeridianus]
MITTAGQAQLRRERLRYTGLLVIGLGLVVTFGIQAILLMPTKYTATSAFALRPTNAVQTDIVVEMVAHDYLVTYGADETADSVADTLDPKDTRPAVEVTAVQDAGSATIRVQVTSTDEDFAIKVANGIAARAVTSGQASSPKAVPVLQAGRSGISAKPPRALYLAALLTLAAMALAAGLYKIRQRTT